MESLDADFWFQCHFYVRVERRGISPDFSGPEEPFSSKIIGYQLDWTYWDHRVQFLTLILLFITGDKCQGGHASLIFTDF